MRQIESRSIIAQHIHFLVSFWSALALVKALLPWLTYSFAFATWNAGECQHEEGSSSCATFLRLDVVQHLALRLD